MKSISESALSFPCDFPIKALGHSCAEFDRLVLEIVHRHAPQTREGSLSSRSSTGGNYTAVTVTILAASQDQLDAIYRDLTDCKQVLMAL